MVIITKHADERADERMSFNHKTLEHLLPKVLSEGINSSMVKGKIKKYLDFLYLSHKTHANNIRIFGEFVYIFMGETLITIMNLPNEHKNYKKYLKNTQN